MLFHETELGKLYHGDCLDLLPSLEDASVNMVLCDLPYGTTHCDWDAVIPFPPLWEEYERIVKEDGAIVLTASQPFTAEVVKSNPALFRYELIWRKNRPTGFLDANRKPLKIHESVLVFYKKQPTYNPQFGIGRPYVKKPGTNPEVYNDCERIDSLNDGRRYPLSVIEADVEPRGNGHPTGKPVSLFEYLLRTFTNEGDLVLDNCLGGGTTAVACEENKRRWVGMELEEKYCALTVKRLNDVQPNLL